SDLDGDPQVMALELQQLTTALVDEVRPAQAQPRLAIAIELAGEADDPQLRERLQIGLLERGFALTRAPGSDDVRLCVIASGEGTFVHAVAGADACDRDESATRVGEGASVEIGRALLIDQASASIEQFIAGPMAEPVDGVAAPGDEPVLASEEPSSPSSASDAEPPTEPERRPVSLAVTASGGVFGRAGGADPLIDVGLRAGRRRGVGGGLALAIVPSRAESLRIIEYLPSAALDWRLGFARRGLAVLAAFAGVHVHRYVHERSGAEPGLRLGPSVGASVRLAYLGSRGALLFGGVRAGWSGGRWVHLVDGEPSWRRSGVLIGVELGAGWDFEVGGRR